MFTHPIVFDPSRNQGSATGWATRLENFRPGGKFNFEPGTRPGFEIQPRNRPRPRIPGSGLVFCGPGRIAGPEKLENKEILNKYW